MRVDVDTRRGLDTGVPALLELFRPTDIRASFFVTLGPDRSGLAIRRALRPSFLVKMWRTNPVKLYGLRTLLSGTLLPARLVGAAAPPLLRQIAGEGHEVAPHGWDHVGWQDRIHRWPPPLIRADLASAARAFESALGMPPQASAAPGWRTSQEALAIQEDFGFLYTSDTRGTTPFWPLLTNKVLKTIQIPTTLPTMDELFGRVRDLPGALLDGLRSGLNVFTLHAEVEGGPLRSAFQAFLGRARRAGVAFIRLDEGAARARAAGDAVPVAPLARGRVSGRSGWVSTQGGWAALLVLTLALTGCRGGPWPARAAVDPPRPVAATAERPPPPATPAPHRLIDLLTRIAGEVSEMQNTLAKLMAASREQEDQLLHAQRRLTELEAENRNRPPSIPGGFAPSGPEAPPLAPGPAASATATPAEDLYRAGLDKFRAKEHDAAVLLLYDLVATYPEHPLRESAQFLVAQIFYTQKDYRGALAEFTALLDVVPRGSKIPEALLNIGLCQRNLGDSAQARRTWSRLVQEYPGSAAAQQARRLLN